MIRQFNFTADYNYLGEARDAIRARTWNATWEVLMIPYNNARLARQILIQQLTIGEPR